MKYSIEGIIRARTIKSTQIINKKNSGKAIIVNYLDGTQDVFDLTDENLEKIVEIAEEQGRRFASVKPKILNGVIKGSLKVISLLAILIVSLLFVMFKAGTIVTAFIAPVEVLLLILEGAAIDTFNTKCREKEDLKKFRLYFNEVKDKLNDYKQIIEKEKQLTKEKSNDRVKLNSILDLDNVTLQQVQNINEKVDRYREVEKTKVKKLENPSLY